MNSLIKCISEEPLVINRLAGKKTIAKSGDIFFHIASEFLGSNFKAGIGTAKRVIQVYETIPKTEATYMELFESIPGNWNKKWLSQSQITKVAKHFRKWLRTDGYPTHFLGKINEFQSVDEEAPHKNLVVISIMIDNDDLCIYQTSFDSPAKRSGDFLYRFIVPKVSLKLK